MFESRAIRGYLPLTILFVIAMSACVANEQTVVVAESLGLVDINLRDASDTPDADFYAPAPVIDRLGESREVSFSELSELPGNLLRFSMGAAEGADLFVVNDESGRVEAALASSDGLADVAEASNDLLLRSTFQFVAANAELQHYAIYSTKHGNYALDVADDGVSLVLRDVRSLAAYRRGEASFLTFEAHESPSKLIANGRYFFDAAASKNRRQLVFEPDATWTSRAVSLDRGKLELVSSGATPMRFYAAPIGLDIPFDFNPEQWSRFDNPEFYDTSQTRGNQFASGIRGLDTAYVAQVTSPGLDAATTAAAELMLDTIEASLAAQGSQIRYPRSFYRALRDGMLRRVLLSEESTDGRIGELTVPYIYFTNEEDADGNFHPFMVIATRGVPEVLALLGDVAHPPGDGLARGYAEQAVTRSYHTESFLWRIPMRDYGEVATLDENDLTAIRSLASDRGVTIYDHHNYASINENALAIDGVLVFPSYNNTLQIAQENAELSVRGMHAGRGLGVHYHADPHSAAHSDHHDNTDTGLNLYNEADYVGRNHPPIITIGFDGVAGYGFYLEGDSSSDGADLPLDDFGAHEHDDYGYHYHSMRTERRVPRRSIRYTSHELGPLGAWAGRINFIADFMNARRGFGSGIRSGAPPDGPPRRREETQP